MSLKKTTIAALMAASGLIVSSASMAQGKSADTGFYVGASIGQMKASGSCPAGFSCDFKDTSWKIFGGYRIIRNLAAEVFYADLGSLSITSGGLRATADQTSFGIAALGILPLNPQFDLFGKLGIANTDQKASASSGGLSASASASGSDILFGAGAVYNFTRNFGVRAEWERFNDSEVDNLSIGIQYRF